jgi:hypothetical protein
MLSAETVEPPARRIDGSLFFFRAAIQQRPTILVNGLAQ